MEDDGMGARMNEAELEKATKHAGYLRKDYRKYTARMIDKLIAEIRRLRGLLNVAAGLLCMDDWDWPDDNSLEAR